jgi:hypothetical protein
MAADTNARIQFSLQDKAGLRSSLSMPAHIDGAQTVTQCKTAWNTQAGLLDLVTGCKVLSGEVVIVPSITFTPKSPTPEVDCQIERTGNLDMSSTGTVFVYDSIVPGISTHVLNAALNEINEAQTDMAAYITALSAAILGGNFSNRAYQPFSSIHDSFLSFRKHRRALHSKSLETP